MSTFLVIPGDYSSGEPPSSEDFDGAMLVDADSTDDAAVHAYNHCIVIECVVYPLRTRS